MSTHSPIHASAQAPAKSVTTVSCACGQVVYEAKGAPITSVICYCDDCQEGARQIELLPHAPPVQEPDGGTAYLAYRKDRVTCVRGQSLLRHHKIRAGSATNRVLATCCNSAMLISFDDAKHWVDLYRSRCNGDNWPVQMRICTKFKAAHHIIPAGVPQHPHYPLSLIMKLVRARFAMLLHR
ncbi:GFA family protein [Paraburkholderia sp. DHOC27]|uniref:GFA family protein n=1 Tax=Paraburkholderia sp. DHOC27 TaxID=2303330 RepID=UPI000E3C3A12|nr:hypothetical protein [Paraburkholderia sp. DHOC27]RFU49580.1 hypothetical protein D0B32_07290 [Paraburkholderia sp. DHOC27]